MKIPGDDPDRLREEYERLLAEAAAAGRGVREEPGLAQGDGRPYAPGVIAEVREDARSAPAGSRRLRPGRAGGGGAKKPPRC
ncbi:hypothetical protein ABZY44_07500 [Streptomyces sp. NPDC006544]|uniref:hypothetical protein n=1 Tax=Streptomyces sp. NPDC006544 TaxID=3154583 RepID=UPI0033AFB947